MSIGLKLVIQRFQQGAKLKLSDETKAYIVAVEAEDSGIIGSKAKTNTAINDAVGAGIYDKIALWTQTPDFGRNFFFSGLSNEVIAANTYLIKPVENDIQVIMSTSVDDVMTIHAPAAVEEDGVEENILLTVNNLTVGNEVSGWYGAGTNISRTYEDAKRVITQTISVVRHKLQIDSTVEYKADIKIEKEGFRISGALFADKNKVVASGTGQNIIAKEGMYFHNGDYTPHVVLANMNKNFKYKQYNIGDGESIHYVLVDGSDFVPVRVLLQPDGYDASLTISNHADLSEIDRVRAVHFGSSDINSVDYGQKGLSSRGIKADWSTFAVTSTDNAGFDNADFKQILVDIKATGSEIIPHSLKSTGGNREEAILLLPEFNNSFLPNNWTDHGLSGGAENIGIASRGWDSEDAINYMLDLFEQYGFDMAWSYQDITGDRVQENVIGFPHNIAYYNDHLKLPVSGNHVMLWKSSDRPFYYKWLNLDNLIKNCGSVDSHDYLPISTREAVADDETSIAVTHYIDNGEVKITTGFDNILQQIASKKAEGKIWNPTNTEWHEYFARLKKVRVKLVDNETYIITNDGDLIEGFTMLVYKSGITATLNTVAMQSKSAAAGTIVWGDLNSGENTLKIS